LAIHGVPALEPRGAGLGVDDLDDGREVSRWARSKSL
jgi:hypothetical protein